MASPTVTYTFSNSTTADATEVNSNFTDIINALTDGTSDHSINTITCAGAATFNGNVTLGNASGDDVTVTGSLASTIAIKTTNTYDIGNTTNGLRYLYVSAGGTHVARIGAGTASGDWNFTLPTGAGTKGQALYDTDGAGTLGWVHAQRDVYAVSSTNYTVTDTDGYYTINVTTGASDRTITLPTAADNTDRVLIIRKADSGAGKVIIDGEGSETIDGNTTVNVPEQYEAITIQCDGSGWMIINHVGLVTQWTQYTPTSTNHSTNATHTGLWRRVGQNMEVQIATNFSGSNAESGAWIMSLPSGYTIDTATTALINSSAAHDVWGRANTYDNGNGVAMTGSVQIVSTTTLEGNFFGDYSGAEEAPNAMSSTSPWGSTGSGDRWLMTASVPIAEWTLT
jgi:hypothetical protein